MEGRKVGLARFPACRKGEPVDFPVVEVDAQGRQWAGLIRPGSSRSVVHPVCAGCPKIGLEEERGTLGSLRPLVKEKELF